MALVFRAFRSFLTRLDLTKCNATNKKKKHKFVTRSSHCSHIFKGKKKHYLLILVAGQKLIISAILYLVCYGAPKIWIYCKVVNDVVLLGFFLCVSCVLRTITV